MIFNYILLIFFLIILIASIFFNWMIRFHFKRFKIFDDKNSEKFSRIFTTGTIILLFLCLVFLTLFFINNNTLYD